MNVEKLIEKLQDMDPTANVVFEGDEADTCWTVREAVDDDDGRFVMLLRGKELLVFDEDGTAVAARAGQSEGAGSVQRNEEKK